MEYRFSVPESWYEGCYKDRHICRSAGRSFSLLHKEKTEETWLLVHGFRGYPGELVYPAEQLYEAGFDVFVPHLPGCGTSGRDFANTGRSDWLRLVENAIGDLKKRYRKVHLLGHSMGTCLVGILGAPDRDIGKIVYAAPAFANRIFDEKEKARMTRLLKVKKKERCNWTSSPDYRLHYENAPCDSPYFGKEYWRWTFFGQLLSLDGLIEETMEKVKNFPHESLVLCPMLDRMVTVPSMERFLEETGRNDQVVRIPDGTHFLFYDRDPTAEKQAVDAVLDFARK